MTKKLKNFLVEIIATILPMWCWRNNSKNKNINGHKMYQEQYWKGHLQHHVLKNNQNRSHINDLLMIHRALLRKTQMNRKHEEVKFIAKVIGIETKKKIMHSLLTTQCHHQQLSLIEHLICVRYPVEPMVNLI